MSIQDNYNESKNKFLFNDSKSFSILRSNILKRLDITPKIKKNNESLKYLDLNVLKFLYNYKKLSNDILYLDHEINSINIDSTDGKISTIYKKTNNKIDVNIKNIDSSNKIAEGIFLNFQNYFEDDYVLNLNSLMLNSGYEINIDEKQETTIFILNNITEEELTLFQKNIILCSKGSKVTIIEEFTANKKSNSNIANFITLEEGAELTHLIFQRNDLAANLQLTSYTNCEKNSKYEQLIINISSVSIRNHHYANLNGENASANLDGIFLAANDQIIDNKTQVNHNFPNCKSSQRCKGVLTDRSKASYLSKTFVKKIAQKTEAYQLSKGILLSDDSYFNSKPELMIFADDVKCSHGSTIGPMDRDLLFYLRSRGLNKKESTSLLIKSFFHDMILDIHNKIFLEQFNYYVNKWLKKNNI